MHDDDPMGPQPVTLGDPGAATTMAERTERSMLAFEERRQRPERARIGTPWASLDDALRGGLWPGPWILTGGPGSGKTQLAAQLAAHAALSGIPVVHVAFEMGEHEVMARLLGALARPLVPWSDVLLGQVEGRRWERVEEAASRLRDLPMRIEATRLTRMPPSAVEELCEDVGRAGEPRRLIVLDGVPLASTNDETRLRVHKLMQGARFAMERFDASLLIIAPHAHEAMSPRVLPTAPELPPLVDVVRELGDEATSAHGVLTIVRRPGGPGQAWLALPKLRYAPPTAVELYFSGTMFTEAQAG
jgi:hypothetical protein